MEPGTRHPWIRVTYAGPTPNEPPEVEIDVEMVPVVTRLWRLGIDTDSCCQGDPSGNTQDWSENWAFLGFSDPRAPNPDDYTKETWPEDWIDAESGAERLAKILDRVAPESTSRRAKWAWDWRDLEDFNDGSGIWLPNEDLPYLEGLLDQALQSVRSEIRRSPKPLRARGGADHPSPPGPSVPPKKEVP